MKLTAVHNFENLFPVCVCRFRTSLEAEKVRLSNQTQALELERANTKKYQDAVETERQRGKEENNRLLENIEALRRQVAAAKQEKADLEVQLERERISRSNIESELEAEKALQGEAFGEYCAGGFRFLW